ncbi:4-hydroxypentanoyl-CoA kinase subunit LvaB [Pseudomonas sp.]|uniref:4-hydroxypentanoyl-CoA kinase subunit LvaB n=1 Tax=Pseudomonas sp. TaxID=306 RepID=UPI003C73B91F
MTQPNAHELLDIARATLLEQLLPALPGELRYPALMIANAMAIAARESRLGAQAEDQEQARLAALVDEAPSTLPDMRRQLARAIRQGRHDAPQTRRTLIETLRQVTVARLAISNPKALP